MRSLAHTVTHYEQLGDNDESKSMSSDCRRTLEYPEEWVEHANCKHSAEVRVRSPALEAQGNTLLHTIQFVLISVTVTSQAVI